MTKIVAALQMTSGFEVAENLATAGRLLNRHGPIEAFPPDVLGDQREAALLFKRLATLRTDAPLFRTLEELEWRGPTERFAALADRMGDARLLRRADRRRGL